MGLENANLMNKFSKPLQNLHALLCNYLLTTLTQLGSDF